ncbi:hypothetical protein HY448_02250 [Candidatus Pacearchaeota archaeon]|nr:hypothetical protein [Candidatus Pacearchaeota archaeon]
MAQWYCARLEILAFTGIQVRFLVGALCKQKAIYTKKAFGFMKDFSHLIAESRRKLKENRKEFWSNNKKNHEENLKKLIDSFKIPKGWKLFVTASRFLSKREILPFENGSWSSTNLIAATEKQGFEMMIFFNKARLEFLSMPGLIPIVEHEIEHVRQAARNPKEFLDSIRNDELSRKLEAQADGQAGKISGELRKQWVLESVVYCYDLGSWKAAKKMADFFYKHLEKIHGGGYEKAMTREEYKTFLDSMKKKDIRIFINFFNR